MTRIIRNEYTPDLVSSPGETLEETLNTIGMSYSDLAARMGQPPKMISEIIYGKATITLDTARQLECILGVPAHFWLAREQQYREWRARNRSKEGRQQVMEQSF